MALLTVLYDIIVMPLVYIVDLAFSLLLRQLGNPGMALVGVSLVVNFLCLPLYRMADRMQEEERQRQDRMAERVAQIKRTFKGDEQYMMLSTYYRQMGYKPIYALNGSLSLLLQIPVFMAAYNYLSTSPVLKGASFLFLPDLGAPDGLMVIGGLTLNLMPILMTAFNCVSTFIYTRDLGLRDKVQAYGLAVVFLVLLYQSPSGLVFYWTCNQIFSLLKNVFLKLLPQPEKAFAILMQVLLIWVLGFLVGSGAFATFESALLIIAVFVAIDGPILSSLLGWKPRFSVHPEQVKTFTYVFLAAAVLLTVLVGVLIPATLLGSSPKEFVTASGFENLMQFVVHTGCVQAGLFILWAGTYYFLSDGKGRSTIACVLGCMAIVALIDYFFFDQNLGIIDPTLVYEKPIHFEMDAYLINLLVVVVAVVAFLALWKFAHRALLPLFIIMTAGLVWLALPSINAVLTLTPARAATAKVDVRSDSAQGQPEEASGNAQPAADTAEGEPSDGGATPVPEPSDSGAPSEEGSAAGEENALVEAPPEEAAPGPEYHTATQQAPLDDEGNPLPIFHLSREGRNVVVIFMDRAVGAFVPYCLNARPDLYEKFDGFTYYPNTISFGEKTIFGSPALYGGYEYVPERINEREDMLLVDKHNESLRVMPSVFSQAGFEVTVSDPPMVNYVFGGSDYSIYDDIPGVSAYATDGVYTSYYLQHYLSGEEGEGVSYAEALAEHGRLLKRNLCYYSFFRVVPTFLKPGIYDNGNYLVAKTLQSEDEEQSELLKHLVTRIVLTLGAGAHSADGAQGTAGSTDSSTMPQPEGNVSALSADATTQPADTPTQPADEGTSAAAEEAPAADEGTLAAADEAPAADGETSAAAEEAPATDGETSAAAEEAPATDGETSAAAEEAPATGEETSAEGVEAPVVEGGAPMGEEAPAPDNNPVMPIETLSWAGLIGSRAYNGGLLNWYSELALLPQLTSVEDGGDHFLLIQNSTAHQPDFLQMPDFTPSFYVDNTGYFDPATLTAGGVAIDIQSDYQATHYMVNMAALLRLGEWMDYLRAQGCYDNTRIIIVSDHGQDLDGLFWNLQVDEQFNAEAVNPLFMVKDFGAHGFTTSPDFMTNADTPSIALRDIVPDAVNPATGVVISDEEKYAHDQVITTSVLWNPAEDQSGSIFNTSDGYWYAVHDNIFDPNNWSFLY